jgi:hypothetical protein
LNNYLYPRWDLDKLAPSISWINYSSGSLLPGWNHNLEFNYLDNSEYWDWIWIDINSWNIILEKWDSWNSVWNTVNSKIWTWILTQTLATYSTLDLDYWKYKVIFNISDINWNISSDFESIFYIDKPEMSISTWNIDIWILNENTNTFTWDIIITVKTLWAWFNVKLKKNQELINDNSLDFIPYYDWNLYDFNDDIIWQEIWNINNSWDLNTYIYTVKMWAIIDYLQTWWSYTWKINFWIELTY